MPAVPTYALYGDSGADPAAEFLHCETIETRSRLHDYEIRPHRHENLFQLVFLSAGGGTMACGSARLALAPPCVTLVPARAVHAYSFSNAVQGQVVTLFQDRYATLMRAAPDAAPPSAAEVVPLAAQPGAARAIAAAMDAVAREFADRAPGRVAMMQAHLTLALLTVFRARASPVVTGGAHIERFRELVEQGFARPLAVEDYASRLGITPVHLRRLCRQHLGTTPLGAVNARRILEAKQLLLFSFLGVKEVAAALGFDDHAYFSRFFSRETGFAPSEFRARQRTSQPPEPASPPSPAGAPPGTPPAPTPSRA